jgi:hypothetical protein
VCEAAETKKKKCYGNALVIGGVRTVGL